MKTTEAEKKRQIWRKKMRLLEKAYYKGKNDVSEKVFYEWLKSIKDGEGK